MNLPSLHVARATTCFWFVWYMFTAKTSTVHPLQPLDGSALTSHYFLSFLGEDLLYIKMEISLMTGQIYWLQVVAMCMLACQHISQ